jgi:alkylation response protein AidB-like acyl-CoA dehydrogenase
MHFAFTPDQLEMRDAIRGALQSECTPAVVRASWTTPQPQLWKLLAELGVLGINTPEQAGGLGLGAVDWVLIVEEAGRVALPAPLTEALAALPLLAAAGETALVGTVLSGEGTIALARPGGYASGADTATVVLEVSGTEVRLLENPACVAQSALDGAHHLFSVSGDPRTLAGDGAALTDRATLATAAQLLGLGQQILDTAVSYAKTRTQFSKPIGSFQAVQHHLVDALLKLRFAAPLVYRAAWSLDEHAPDRSVHIAMAKIAASEAAGLACRKSLQVHGAIGYTLELDLHMWMKRVWALTQDWGDPAHHRRTAAAHALGETHA